MERKHEKHQQPTEPIIYTQLHKPGSSERKRLDALRKIDEAKMNLKKTGRKRQFGEPLGPRVPRAAVQ